MTLLKSSNKLFFLLFFTVALFTSCENETTETTEAVVEQNNEEAISTDLDYLKFKTAFEDQVNLLRQSLVANNITDKDLDEHYKNNDLKALEKLIVNNEISENTAELVKLGSILVNRYPELANQHQSQIKAPLDFSLLYSDDKANYYEKGNNCRRPGRFKTCEVTAAVGLAACLLVSEGILVVICNSAAAAEVHRCWVKFCKKK